MSNEVQPKQRRWVLWIGVIAFLIIVWVMMDESKQNNQIVGPRSEPAPVVPQLPDFIADLSSAKSLCEGKARAAKDTARRRQIPDEAMARGRGLYIEAKSSFDGCITYLQTGLTRRFNRDDRTLAEKRLRNAFSKMGAFLEWTNQIQRPWVGASDPLTAALEALSGWMGDVAKANDKAIDQLRADLEKCRLADWGDLPE
jgi:hypothetical protein